MPENVYAKSRARMVPYAEMAATKDCFAALRDEPSVRAAVGAIGSEAWDVYWNRRFHFHMERLVALGQQL